MNEKEKNTYHYHYNSHEFMYIRHIMNDVAQLIEFICNDLHIDSDSYYQNIDIIENHDIINSISIIVTMIACSDKYTTQKITIVCDDFDNESLKTISVLRDNTTDIIRYTLDNVTNKIENKSVLR